MKKYFLRVWRILPGWVQRAASSIILPHFQVVAGAMIFNERGQILLCEHTYRRDRPWGLPGGNLEYHEDPAQAVRRELREETGLEVQEARLLIVSGSREEHRIILTYICSGLSGSFRTSDEVARIDYFDIDSLPEIQSEQKATIEDALERLGRLKKRSSTAEKVQAQ